MRGLRGAWLALPMVLCISVDASADEDAWWLRAQDDAKGTELPSRPRPKLKPKHDLPPFGQGFRGELALGAVADVIYDTPIYMGGIRLGLGRRINGSRWALMAHFSYAGGQTNLGLESHFGAFGLTCLYNFDVLRVGFGPEASYSAIVPFTHNSDGLGDHYGGMEMGHRFLLGAELWREGDNAIFMEWRGGARLSYLAEDTMVIWSPGSLWLGGRFGD